MRMFDGAYSHIQLDALSLLFVDLVAVAHRVTRSCRMPQTAAIFFRIWDG
jgi:hypothetical protein